MIEENHSIPPPINFNCWKHHAGFIKTQIKVNKDIDKLKSCLKKIGESQMDLYFGKYSPAEISRKIIELLKKKQIFLFQQFQEWLTKEGKDFQTIQLKDKSVWTIRLGDNRKRYVHIHPGRHSHHTVRVKAATLKTAILVLYLKHYGEIKSIQTETVNQIRKTHIKEPPIKSLSSAVGLCRLLDILRGRIEL